MISIAFVKSRELIQSTYSHCFKSKYKRGAQEGKLGSRSVAKLSSSLVCPAVAYFLTDLDREGERVDG